MSGSTVSPCPSPYVLVNESPFMGGEVSLSFPIFRVFF